MINVAHRLRAASKKPPKFKLLPPANNRFIQPGADINVIAMVLVKALLKKPGITMSDLAKHFDVSLSTIKKVAKGEHVSFETYCKLGYQPPTDDGGGKGA
jgi:hypothetical protein